MNISKAEQRVLHVLAQGGSIHHERGDNRKIIAVVCVAHDNSILTDCTTGIFARLLKRGLIASSDGHPYRISRSGRLAVRSQLDNRPN